jgi:hypothetical protein
VQSVAAGKSMYVASSRPRRPTPTEAQRRAARARARGDKADFYHWAKVAAEIARISPQAEMDIQMVTAIVAEEERRSG